MVTVAGVTEYRDRADLRFFESARIYRLSRTHPRYEVLVGRLAQAARTGVSVQVRVEDRHDDVIADVQ